MLGLLKRSAFPWLAARSKERRLERRYRVSYACKIVLLGESTEAYLEDVTLGGARLRLSRKVRVGQAVLVNFPCGLRDAVCRWSRGQGSEWIVGVQFVTPNPPS